jgi:hypothetical protein
MRMALNHALSMVAAALLLTGPMAAHSANLTQNITLTGTVSPPPVSCTFSGSPTLLFNSQATNEAIEARTDIIVNCSGDTTFVLAPAARVTAVTIGGTAAGLGILNNSYDDLDLDPIVYSGAGTPMNITILGVLNGGADMWAPLDAKRHLGVVSGTVQLVLTY